jgi:molybdate transport system permease protein
MKVSSSRLKKWAPHHAWKLTVLPYLLFIALPILALLLGINPDDFRSHLQETEVIQAVQTSFITSTCTVLLALLFGTPIAYYLSNNRSRFQHLVDTLIDLPTVLPPAVAGVALLLAFGRRGMIGSWLNLFGISIPFTLGAVILAQTFIATPLYIKSATLGFSAIDTELKKAAALDGASHWQIFRYIVVPMSWMSILSGAVMTWARALGEFGATIIFAGNFPGRTQTMPLAIYIGFEINMSTALSLSAILVTISFITLILIKHVLHENLQPSECDYLD